MAYQVKIFEADGKTLKRIVTPEELRRRSNDNFRKVFRVKADHTQAEEYLKYLPEMEDADNR